MTVVRWEVSESSIEFRDHFIGMRTNCLRDGNGFHELFSFFKNKTLKLNRYFYVFPKRVPMLSYVNISLIFISQQICILTFLMSA